MPKAARVMDTTAHGVPMQGPGSPDVFIGNMKAWRAMPAGVGAGLEQASKDTKAIMDVKPTPVEAFILMQVKPKVAKIQTAMDQVAGQVESETKTPGARASVKAAFLTLETTGIALDAVYQTASKAPAPGAEPAARAAFTIGYQKALAAAMSASVASLAGPWDMHTCAAPGPNPHGPGFVMKGCQTVFINNLPAVMEGQELMEAAGGPNAIKVGCGTVIIGDKAPSSSSGSGGSNAKAKSSGASSSAKKTNTAAADAGSEEGSADSQEAAEQPEEVLFDLRVRLNINPNTTSEFNDVFLLTSDDGSVSMRKTIADDQVPNDDSVDLLFAQLDVSKAYSLKIIDEDGEHFAFESVPGSSLQSGEIGSGEDSNGGDSE